MHRNNNLNNSLVSEYGYYPERITSVLKDHGLLADFEVNGFQEFVRGT
jgi:hypothetical protein